MGGDRGEDENVRPQRRRRLERRQSGCPPQKYDFILFPGDPLIDNQAARDALDEGVRLGLLDSFSVIESKTPIFVAFFYLKNADGDWMQDELLGKFGVSFFILCPIFPQPE